MNILLDCTLYRGFIHLCNIMKYYFLNSGTVSTSFAVYED
jgi:hypothetical protein